MQHRVELVARMAREIRRESLAMIYAAGSGHPGGSLSEADILSALYFDAMNLRPDQPNWSGRDRFVLSKGHACPAFYAVLALKGYFDRSKLSTLREFGSGLQGHPVMGKLPGIDMTTGSLGQGLSIAAGMALAARRDESAVRVYTLIGDGECDEGQIWEAAMTASKYGLGNLCAIIDHNGLQNDDTTGVIQPIENLAERFADFGWRAVTVNGHDPWQLLSALDDAKLHPGIPTCIVARTVKGKGVSFMENVVAWHGKVPNDDEYAQAMRELEVR
jgi:transketolase